MNVHLTQFHNIIEHQKNAFGQKEMSLNKVLTFMSTMQQTALRSDYFWAKYELWKYWSGGRGCWNCCAYFHPQSIIHPLQYFIRNVIFHPQSIYHSLCDLSSNVQIIIHCAIIHPLRKWSSTVRLYIHCGGMKL